MQICHSGVSNYLAHTSCEYLDKRGVRDSIVSSTLSFDATLTTLLSPLCIGGTVELLGEDDSLEKLAGALASDSPKLFKITPAHLEGLDHYMGADIATGHIIIVGGEALHSGLLARCQQVFSGAAYVNEYGPTETVVGCCIYTVEPGQKLVDLTTVPIGVPIQNTQLYVLGADGELLPEHAEGELYIGGAGVSKGYLNRQDMTGPSLCARPV